MEIDVRGKETDGFSRSLLSDADELERVERMELGEMFGVAASIVASMEDNLQSRNCPVQSSPRGFLQLSSILASQDHRLCQMTTRLGNFLSLAEYLDRQISKLQK